MVMGQDDMAHHSDSLKKSTPVVARATLSCVKFSHPFQNRSLFLEPKAPVKIGRSGPHISCAPNNAIFDCVVISRDHARIWFDDGRFYLQDTKSSNGTFVNNELIGEKAKESPPMLVYTGDILQFGSAVFSPDMKSRLGAIIGVLKLYLPNGSEAPSRPPLSAASTATSTTAIPAEQLYQLSACLQEAEHREQKLRKKLVILQHIVETSWKAAGEAWKALVNEDLLLSKLDLLQRRLEAISKDSPDDRLRQEMVKLNEGLSHVTETSKKQIEKALLDMTEGVQKRNELEMCRDNLESECAFYKTVAKQTQDDLKDLGQKYTLYFEKYQAVSQKGESDRNIEKCKILEQEKRQLKEYADQVVAEKEMLEKRMKAFQTANPLGPTTHAEGVLENKKADPGSTIKPKFSVTLVHQNLELTEDVTSELEPSDQGQSRVDILFKRFEHIERAESIRSEKLNNIRLQLESLRAQSKSSQGSNMAFSLEEHLDSIENELSLILPMSNESSSVDPADIDDSTKYANEVINNLKAENIQLTLQLHEAQESLRYLDAKKDFSQMDCQTPTLNSSETGHGHDELKKKLIEAHAEIKTKNNTVIELMKKTFMLEKSSEEDLQHVGILQNTLEEQQVQNDQLKRDYDTCKEQLVRMHDALRKSRAECRKLDMSTRELTSEADMLFNSCERLKMECARNEASKKTYQAAQDDFIVLNQKLFEQMRIIEKMQADLTGVERERGMVGDLVRDLAEARQENADLLARKVDHFDDPTLGYFFPLIVALVFVFAFVLLSQRQPLESQTQDSTR